jgi:magnesium transporter
MEEVPVFQRGDQVAEALRYIEHASSPARHLAVCEDGRLIGIVEAAALLGARDEGQLAALAIAVPAVVRETTGAERAAWLAAHRTAHLVAVTDDKGSFLGIIPSQKFLPLLVQEHELDLARLGGFMRGTRQARTASEEPVWRRVWHRAPWLLVGLAGAVVSAEIVRSFESELEGKLALAFFLPGIVYMADAVGTQTEVLVIRGLSVGVSARSIARLEVLTGALVGALLSLAVFPFALFLTGDTGVSVVVALALMASTSCATAVAMSLPWLLQRLKLDPAFGSGPLATVVQDLLSIVIYFSIALFIVD